METNNQSKKIERKLRKLQHVVHKETGVTCVSEITKVLAICNAGLVSGLTEEVVVENFEKYGVIENIILIPGKSCSFVSYRDIKSAKTAFETCNGILKIAQNQKPIYLSFVEKLLSFNEEKSWTQTPKGLIILENFINDEEEGKLTDLCKFDNTGSASMKNRLVKHYGYEFRYDINNVNKDKPLKEPIPNDCDFLWKKLKNTDLECRDFIPNQLTINHYSPGQGIPHHIDTHSAFEDPILSLSLKSSVIMDFKNGTQHFCVLLPRRSLAIMSGESRYNWTHGITPRKFDVIKSQNAFSTLQRDLRISFTFRKILQGECTCDYPLKCDSNEKNLVKHNIQDEIAFKIEQTHVHDVYENIANHFSDTRHKPWPNVLEFVQSLNCGSILVDIGCGNGKYLGHNKNIYELGCDRSFALIDVCHDRNFNVFNANCLNIPLRENIADAALSIAVIHHLANEERRLMAVKEMVRILKPKGKALIYVWAKDQHKDKQKSSYIKQDRKNRKSIDISNDKSKEEEIVVGENVTLPVHTNRTQFKHKNILVPWKLKNSDNCDQNTFLRFYHVFEENALDNLCNQLENIQIVKSYYDQGNWCVIFEKIK